MQERRTWRWGLGAALAMGLLALIPQAHLRLVKGHDWQGAYASYHPDERAYLSYLNALTLGRPRLSDPYTGRDDAPATPLPESLFSIQFIPAYAAAIPARILGLSAPTIFIALPFLTAFFSTLFISRLFYGVTGDHELAATGALWVLCFGALVRLQKLTFLLGGTSTPYIFLPFLRRSMPAVPFPLFFLLCLAVWHALTSEKPRARFLSACGAGLIFALLVFSYFYLWTAAAAWLACLALLWLSARSGDRPRALRAFGVIALPAVVALSGYALLLSHRAPTMDTVQILEFSRLPDLSRPLEWLDLGIIAVLLIAAKRGRVCLRSRATLFTLSFALTPLVVFNQQIVTGRSLQPIHYEMFIANYLTLMALFLTLWLIRRGGRTTTMTLPARVASGRGVRGVLLAGCALLALAWGAMEMCVASARHIRTAVARDEAHGVARRLAELARAAPGGTAAAAAGAARPVVFAEAVQAETLVGVASLPVLWAPQMIMFSGVTPAEHKERFYQQLYYSGIDAEDFAELVNKPTYVWFYLFGWERSMKGLSRQASPITRAEQDAEIRSYADYIDSFDREHAARPVISYLVVAVNEERDVSNFDRWYDRDAGERVGNFMLHRVKLRR
ncbi:MAG: hypothetical protein ACR2G4_16135 [Pyrinomonadaceae bacterium]